MNWEAAVEVLRRWRGRGVVIVPILEPGISLTPFSGELAVAEPRPGVLRVSAGPYHEPYISLFRSTFIEASWVPGREDQGLSVVQGGTRVDVFVEGGA